MTPARRALLDDLAGRIHALPSDRVLRVGVDGVDGAGETRFADELADALRARGRRVHRATVDAFHHPRATRYRRGRDSPEGFYLDSFDHATLRRVLLDPLAPGGSGRFRAAAFDHRADRPVDAPEQEARPGDVLLLDGIFLHRPELRDAWDSSVFLDVAFPVSVARMAQRDGTPPDPDAPANRRYVEGQRLYLAACDPRARATVVVDNNDLASPRLARDAPP